MSLHIFTIDESRDPRQDDWFFMSSPVPMLLCCLCYILMVVTAPIYTRLLDKPLGLRKTLLAYNILMVIVNGYISIEIFLSTWSAGYSYVCQPLNFSEDPLELRVTTALYFYTLTKPIELLDTLFLILRKKFNQLSFLHVYHHASMLVFIWIGERYAGGGTAFLVAMLNSFVHTVMYSYYGLAALFPGANFWWKKYLTLLQMFVLGIFMGVQMLYFDCPYPSIIRDAFVFLAVSFLLLFSNFWASSYAKIEIKTRLLAACFPEANSKQE